LVKLPVVSGREVIRALEKKGFKLLRTRGSHAVLQCGSRVVVVPLHKELAKGTLKSILRQAGLTVEEFLDLLKDCENA